MTPDLPIAVIGAGPVGLAAAAHLVTRGLPFVVFEKGTTVGAAVAEWGHVRVFSPWSYNIDAAAAALLAGTGWIAPNPQALPTGREIVRRYLVPLAVHAAIAPHVRLGSEVLGLSRDGLDKQVSTGRVEAPFVIRWRDSVGEERRTLARAVIDASGTWGQPNPLGADGLPVIGEAAAADRIAYGIPDILGRDRGAYAGARVLVAGAGHSAINVVLDLLRLQETAPGTHVLWALRHGRIEKLFGGGGADQLPERGALGLAARRAIADGRLAMLAPFAATRVDPVASALAVTGRHNDGNVTLDVDRIVVATGFRPDLALARELRVALDPAIEAPPALAPLIDPNLHSCGTVPAHGAAELRHPEPGFYIVGAKSYGRAPTVLMATGYEQVRSVVAEIAGDHQAAREVRLVLPETGVCAAAPSVTQASGCCSPRPAGVATAVAAGAPDPAIAIRPAGAGCCGKAA